MSNTTDTSAVFAVANEAGRNTLNDVDSMCPKCPENTASEGRECCGNGRCENGTCICNPGGFIFTSQCF